MKVWYEHILHKVFEFLILHKCNPNLQLKPWVKKKALSHQFCIRCCDVLDVLSLLTVGVTI